MTNFNSRYCKVYFCLWNILKTCCDHFYIVRMINYRYEVRIVNPNQNEMMYTTNDFNDAVDFVDEYKSAHSDLVLYDLKTGKFYEGNL